MESTFAAFTVSRQGTALAMPQAPRTSTPLLGAAAPSPLPNMSIKIKSIKIW
jgi:hypothetical protein